MDLPSPDASIDSPKQSPRTLRDSPEQIAQTSRSRPPTATEAARQRSRSASTSYKVFRRDILYRSINEFQLSGRNVNAYSDLLSRLSFDLVPLLSEGETWYRCRGKTSNDRPCRRLIPEVYLRTAIGRVLQIAEKPQLKGDELVEELAAGLAYAICSEHHQTIHKIARATECYSVIKEYHRVSETGTSAIREESPAPSKGAWSVEEQIKQAIARAPSLDRHPRPLASRTGSAPMPTAGEGDPLSSYEQAERTRAQRNFQDYLIRASSIRASSRGRQGSSNTSSPVLAPQSQQISQRDLSGTPTDMNGMQV